MLRAGAIATLLCLVSSTLGACASSDTPSTATSQSPEIVNISISGDSVTPNGDRVSVRVGQPVDLVVQAEEPGEIHVHSRPDEQEFTFEPGTTTFMIEIDSPGVVEVESHTLGKTIVQLEVR